MADTVSISTPKSKRKAHDPVEARTKLQDRIRKLQDMLNCKQTELAVTASPEVAKIESKLKEARAMLAAANRFEALASKKLKRLREEVSETEQRIADYQADRSKSQARIAELEPKLEAAKAGVSDPDEVPAGE